MHPKRHVIQECLLCEFSMSRVSSEMLQSALVSPSAFEPGSEGEEVALVASSIV